MSGKLHPDFNHCYVFVCLFYLTDLLCWLSLILFKGTNLVKKAIYAMVEGDCDEVTPVNLSFSFESKF